MPKAEKTTIDPEFKAGQPVFPPDQGGAGSAAESEGRSFLLRVNEFFGHEANFLREQAQASSQETEREENLAYAEKVMLLGKNLASLNSPDMTRLAQKNPYREAEELGFLAGAMAASNPEAEMNLGIAREMPDLGRENFLRHGQAKGLFLESSKKVFPEVAVVPDQYNRLVSGSLQVLSEIESSGLLVEMYGADIKNLGLTEIQRLAKEQPEELISKLDYLIEEMARGAQERVFGGVKTVEEFTEMDNDEKKNLAKVDRIIYILQMIRDQVHDQCYGHGKSPEEVQKMKDLRAARK